jgi:NAD(P)-dependent dehydrogenase (short-subunit alcohol dehydrogenase family)
MQTAIECSKAGANLIITGRNNKRLSATLNKCEKGNHKTIIADLTKQDDINNLISQINNIDGVVHSAGIAEYMPCKFISEENFYNIMDINFKAPVLITSLLLRKKKLNKQASIVFISSIASRLPSFGVSLYASSKAAIEGFSRSLSIEIASKKMRSNCLSPTFVETELLDGAKNIVSNESIEKYKNLLPLGFGTTADVANASIFLLSDESKWITGESIKLGSL